MFDLFICLPDRALGNVMNHTKVCVSVYHSVFTLNIVLATE